MVGFGIRLAQDVGVHRRKVQHGPTAEDEQWKRGFWYVILYPIFSNFKEDSKGACMYG